MQEQGLGYDATLDSDFSHIGGSFYVNAAFHPEKEDTVKNIIAEAYDDLQNNKVKQKELDGIKTMLMADWPPHSEDVAEEIFRKIAFNKKKSMFLSKKVLEDITREDILETAQKYLSLPKVEVLLRPKKYK